MVIGQHGAHAVLLLQPVFDLLCLEPGDGFQVGVGIFFHQRRMQPDDGVSQQRYRQREREQQPGQPFFLCCGKFGIRRRRLLGSHRLAPALEQQVEQAAGDGDEQQPLGQFNATLQQRVGHAEGEQEARGDDPQRSECRIQQRNAEGCQALGNQAVAER